MRMFNCGDAENCGRSFFARDLDGDTFCPYCRELAEPMTVTVAAEVDVR